MESALLQLQIFRGLVNASTPPVHVAQAAAAIISAIAPTAPPPLSSESLWDVEDVLMLPEESVTAKPRRGHGGGGAHGPVNILRDIGRVCVEAGFVRREVLARILADPAAKGETARINGSNENAGDGGVTMNGREGRSVEDVIAMMAEDSGMDDLGLGNFGGEASVLGGLEGGEGEVGLEVS